MAFELLETIEVGSGGAASLEFTSIADTGVDLICFLSSRSDAPGTKQGLRLTLNSDTASNYSRQIMYATGTTDTANREYGATRIDATAAVPGDDSVANTFGVTQIYISNYTSTATKPISIDWACPDNALTASAGILAGEYVTTSTISSLKLEPSSGSFTQYTTAYLYAVS